MKPKRDVTLPYLRIEQHHESIKYPGLTSSLGFGILILGKTIIDEVSLAPEFKNHFNGLCKLAERLRTELGRINIDATATKVSIMIPFDQNAKVIWPI